MLRGLVRLIIVLVVIVAIAAFFFGYRWASPRYRADVEPTTSAPAVGTTGTSVDERDRARRVGAEVGDKIAVGANAAERALANGQLTAKIKAKMALDDTVRALAIDIDTDDGVVTLSGTVGSQAEHQRAVQLARETDGVKSVNDRLTSR